MITYVLGTDFIMVQAVRLETIVEKQNKNTEKSQKLQLMEPNYHSLRSPRQVLKIKRHPFLAFQH